jgi:hypothetical protein
MLQNSYVVWEGASLIDGSPIVLILTGFVSPTSNRKTGRLIQSWILQQEFVLLQQLSCVRNDKQ